MIQEDLFPGKVGLLQRVLPLYRAPFFDALSGACGEGLSLAAGAPRPNEAIETTQRLVMASYRPLQNMHIGQGRYYFCWQRGVRSWLEETQPEALIVEANPRYLSTPQAVRWMHGRHRPVIGWGLGVPGGSFFRQVSRKHFLSQFDALISYSRQGAEQYLALGFAPESVFVAPNAMAARPDHPLPQRGETFQGRPVVLFVGRLQSRKRIDLLLHACAALEEAAQPDVWIVGDGPVRGELENLANAIYPRATFYGALHGLELEPYFTRADLFVLPGTGGLAVQQAMSFGLPVIVAEADGTQEDLVRPENGWQIPPGDGRILQTALAEALAVPSRLRRMGEASYRIVRDEINREAMVAVFVEALQFAASAYNEV